MKSVCEIINLAGSAENFIGTQFSYLQEHGDYEMHLICSDGANLKAFAEREKIKYYAVELPRQVSLKKDIKAWFNIIRYLKKEHIDVVICHQAKSRLLGTTAAWVLGVPRRIVFAHGVLYETMTGLKRWLVKTNDKFVSSLATDVVCVSQYVKYYRLKDRIDNPDKIKILHNGSCNGIDTAGKFNPSLVDNTVVENLKNRFGLTENDFVVGFCGRLVKDKGVIELLEGMSLLWSKHRNKSIKLLVIGSPEQRDRLSDDILEELKNNKRIVFTGVVPYDQIQNYYLLMDVFILPSHREGLGMVQLEAQAMGIPAIVSKVTGCKETIKEGVTGNYCELNGKSICEGIEKFFDKGKSSLMGKQGRKFIVEKYERQIVNQAMLELLNAYGK